MEYEKAFKCVLKQGESYIKDKYFIIPNQHIGEYVCGAAFGDWKEGVPKGYVMAYAGIVQEQKDYKLAREYDPTTENQFLFPAKEFTSGMYFKPGTYPEFVPVPPVKIPFKEFCTLPIKWDDKRHYNRITFYNPYINEKQLFISFGSHDFTQANKAEFENNKPGQIALYKEMYTKYLADNQQ